MRPTSTKADSWLFKSRGKILFQVFLFTFLLSIPAVAYRQVQFTRLANKGIISQEINDPIPAKRGAFIDRNNKPIATCSVRYEIFANPRQMAEQKVNIEMATAELVSLLGIDALPVHESLMKNSTRVVLCETSTPAQRDALVNFKKDTAKGNLLKEVGVERFYERFYPVKGMPGNILGWVCRDGSSIKGGEGMEYSLDYLLGGHEGLRSGTRGLDGLPMTASYRVIEESINGNDVLLTIDRDVQEICYEAISHWVQKTGALRGGVLVVKPGTGDFIAAAQYPDVEPTNYKACLDDLELRKDFLFRALYEPGSTGKAIIAAVTMDAALLTPESTFFVDNPPIHLSGYPVGEYTPIWPEAGRRSLREILVRSSNIGMSRVGLAVEGASPGIVAHAFYQFGFDQQPKIYYSGIPGAMIPEDRVHKSDIETANLSFGQGYAISMAQMVLAFNVFASDGVYYPGRLVYGVRDAITGEVRIMDESPSRQAISEETCASMVDILHEVTTNPKGTGRRAVVEGYDICGKTGTGQVASPNGGYYPDSEHYFKVSFAGFGPIPDPKYTILIVVERPRGKQYDAGGKTAAPCFHDIFSALMDLEKQRSRNDTSGSLATFDNTDITDMTN